VASPTTRSSSQPNSRVFARLDTLARVGDELEQVTRAVAAAGIAGVLVGVPAGLLARLVMKVSAVAAGPVSQGVQTENGNVVGALTADGTLALVIFAGLAPVGAGAILYVAVRPWFLSLRRWRGVAFGLYLLAVAGTVGLDPVNGDFSRFGPAPLNVAMFAGLFVAVGLALAPVAEWTLALLSSGRWGLVALGFVFGVLDAGLVLVIGTTTIGSWLTGQQPALGAVAVAMMLASVAIGVTARRGGPSLLSYAALGVPLAVGLWQTGNAVATLLR
jgi:hypothetical protein